MYVLFSATCSPVKQKNASKEDKGDSHGNLVLTIQHGKTGPSGPTNTLLPYNEYVKQIQNGLPRDVTNTFRDTLPSVLLRRTLNNPWNVQASEDGNGKDPVLALIPMRGRRNWRRRSFHIYNTVPDAGYRFNTVAIDPMFYFLGIGK
jgi:hypothetical protein